MDNPPLIIAPTQSGGREHVDIIRGNIIPSLGSRSALAGDPGYYQGKYYTKSWIKIGARQKPWILSGEILYDECDYQGGG